MGLDFGARTASDVRPCPWPSGQIQRPWPWPWKNEALALALKNKSLALALPAKALFSNVLSLSLTTK